MNLNSQTENTDKNNADFLAAIDKRDLAVAVAAAEAMPVGIIRDRALACCDLLEYGSIALPTHIDLTRRLIEAGQ